VFSDDVSRAQLNGVQKNPIGTRIHSQRSTISFPPFLLPFKSDGMGPSTGIEWIFLLTRLRHRLASPSMLLHKSKACEKAASVDSRAYHTEACSQKIFGFNDIFPYGEGLPVLNRNSQLKRGEFHKNSAPRKQRPIRS